LEPFYIKHQSSYIKEGGFVYGTPRPLGHWGETGIHVKTPHHMFGPKGNPTAANLFHIIACLQEQEGVRLRVVA
jgi:hypothetical protein